MADLETSRCARPTLTRRGISSYTIFGFVGYGVANIVCAWLAIEWRLSLGDRLASFLIPPAAFVVVVMIATAIAGHERIVFYQTTIVGIAALALTGWVAGLHTALLLDIATTGIGLFLVFGRIGCFSVACCHGMLGRGVSYGPAHVALGFWNRWCARPLWPVQLIESLGSLILVVVALASAQRPGDVALVYVVGYSALRFALELGRGDSARPIAYGLSEAQWLSLACAAAAALWRPGTATVGVCALLGASAAFLVATRRRRELLQPIHLHELDELLVADGQRRTTSLDVAVSGHVLADGRTDWVLSTQHPAWSARTAHRLSRLMWRRFELVEGRAPGVVHVLTGPS